MTDSGQITFLENYQQYNALLGEISAKKTYGMQFGVCIKFGIILCGFLKKHLNQKFSFVDNQNQNWIEITKLSQNTST